MTKTLLQLNNLLHDKTNAAYFMEDHANRQILKQLISSLSTQNNSEDVLAQSLDLILTLSEPIQNRPLLVRIVSLL